jgi:hypothetical protein
VRRGSAAVRRLIAMISSLRKWGAALLTLQLVAQRLDHDAGDRLAGPGGKLAREPVGLGITDVENHACDHAGVIQHGNIAEPIAVASGEPRSVDRPHPRI